MRIFLTGATGYIGSAVLDALARAGHEVTALVRNAEKAALVAARGATPIIGNLSQPASYRDGAADHDGYVHAAFESGARGPEVDRVALDTLIGAAGRRRAFLIYTSSVWVLGNTREPADERAPLNPVERVAWRPAHEQLVLNARRRGVRAIVVRPGIVYGNARGIVADMVRDAMNGLIRVVGSGENHWPLVYDRDLGDLYARVAAGPDAAGVYHANDEGDERVNDVAEALAVAAPRRPAIRHMPLKEARAKLGDYADALALDQIVRSPRARALGWSPTLTSVARNAPRLFEEWRAGQEAA